MNSAIIFQDLIIAGVGRAGGGHGHIMKKICNHDRISVIKTICKIFC